MSIKLVPDEITLPEKIGFGKEKKDNGQPHCTLGHLKHVCNYKGANWGYRADGTYGMLNRDEVTHFEALHSKFTLAMKKVVRAFCGREFYQKHVRKANGYMTIEYMNDLMIKGNDNRALVNAATWHLLGWEVSNWPEARRLAKKAHAKTL